MKLLHINRDIIVGDKGEGFSEEEENEEQKTFISLMDRINDLEHQLYEANVKIEQVKSKYFWTGLWVGLLTFIAFTLIP